MPNWISYQTGLFKLADGCYGYFQPDGTWGLSNAGLVVGKDQSFCFDALCDVPRTKLFLDACKRAEPKAASQINHVAISHRHPDHTQGLAAFDDHKGCNIIMTNVTWKEWEKHSPDWWTKMIAGLDGAAKEVMDESIGTKFDFTGMRLVPPTQTFDDYLELDIGGRKVILQEVGPGHSFSDIMGFVPDVGVAFTGDVLSPQNHIGYNNAPWKNQIKLLDKLLEWGPSKIVPGHRALCDLADIGERKQYLLWLEHEARKRFDKGMEIDAAARDLIANLGPYSHYTGAPALFNTLYMMFQEWKGNTKADARADFGSWGGLMAKNHANKDWARSTFQNLPITY